MSILVTILLKLTVYKVIFIFFLCHEISKIHQ